MVIMHSVIDIFGVNEVSRVFRDAVGAVSGMMDSKVNTQLEGKNVVAMTMYGNTTPAAIVAKERFEKNGYEVVVFHPNGTGGMCMEELIDWGLFTGVFDLTTHEITDWLYRGVHAGGPAGSKQHAKRRSPRSSCQAASTYLMGPVNSLAPETQAAQTLQVQSRRFPRQHDTR